MTMTNLNHYIHYIKCFNCNSNIRLSIPKGTTVNHYLASAVRKKENPIICENCGVKTDG